MKMSKDKCSNFNLTIANLPQLENIVVSIGLYALHHLLVHKCMC